MYCHACGIYNTDDRHHCRICQADLTAAGDPKDAIVYADLRHFPLLPLLLHSLRSTNPLLWILIIPIVSLLYCFRKLTGTPFLSALMNSHAPKLHEIDIAELGNLHKPSFQKALSVFEREGFEPLIDLEDVSMAQGIILHVRYHPQHKTFAMAHIHKASGRTNYVTFLAFIPKSSFLSVDNIHTLSIHLPQHLKVIHLPDASVQESFQHFCDRLKESPCEPAALSLAGFLRHQNTLRQYTVKQGLQQQLLHHKDKGTRHAPPVSTCYFHPSRIAVRKCATCGTALCESCYTEFDARFFCTKCLPAKEAPHVAAPNLPDGFSYAGFGIRSLASFVDAALIATFLAAIFLGILHGTRILLTNMAENPYPFLVTQFAAVITITCYLIFPVKKSGATFGQKLFGLRIIDKYGRTPDMVTALVRFSYHLVACLFLFPFLGYLFVLFKKNKQGLHDRLAGTFVITKRPMLKAFLAWCLLCLLLAGAAWQTYQYRDVFFAWSSFLSTPESYQTNIELDAQWVKHFSNDDTAIISYVNRGEHCIVSTAHAVYAIDMHTGETVWVNDQTAELSLLPALQDETFPLLGTQYLNAEGTASFTTSLSRLDPISGNVLWQIPLQGDFPYISFDAHLILVYEGSSITGYDLDSNQIWTRRFNDELTIDYTEFHSGVLLGRYSESAVTLTYLDRNTGETLWETSEATIHPGYVLERDRQFFHAEDGTEFLMNVHENRPLWEAPKAIGHTITHAIEPVSGRTYVYTSTAAIDPTDGAPLFTYPEGLRFEASTPEFLLLFQGSDAGQNTIVLLDKFTGEPKKTLENTPWSATTYLTENFQYIYFLATMKPLNPRDITVRSHVLRFDRTTFDVTAIPVGSNLSSLYVTLFPDEALLFIPSYQQLGGYVLPEM